MSYEDEDFMDWFESDTPDSSKKKTWDDEVDDLGLRDMFLKVEKLAKKKEQYKKRLEREKEKRKENKKALIRDLKRDLPRSKDTKSTPKFTLLRDLGECRSYTLFLAFGHRLEGDPKCFLKEMEANTKHILISDLRRWRGVKFSIVLEAEFSRITPGGEEETSNHQFHSKGEIVMNSGEITEKINEARKKIMTSYDTLVARGSNWNHKRNVCLDLRTAQYKPFKGRSYFPTPDYIPPRSVINVKNKDNRCFEWAILSALYPVGHGKNPNKLYNYEAHLGELDFAGINFPVQITDIKKFERQNPTLSVNVFSWENGLYPQYISDKEKKEEIDILKEIDLLLLIDIKNNDDIKSHYVWIKNLSTMLYQESKYKVKKHPCRRCLHIFSTDALLQNHKTLCKGINNKAQRTQMPDEDNNILEFKNYKKQMRMPYVAYGDFECTHTQIQGCLNEFEEMDPEKKIYTKSFTRQIAKQEACSFGCIIAGIDGIQRDPVIYRGENAPERFLEHLWVEADKIYEIYKKPRNLRMSKDDWTKYNSTNICHICEEPIDDDKVRDHCHITGKFRGAAHNDCNLKLAIYPESITLPVVFHNLRGYDGHLIMDATAKKTKTADANEKITCIPNTIEKYMSFTIIREIEYENRSAHVQELIDLGDYEGAEKQMKKKRIVKLMFIDSLQFMNSSLDRLVSNTSELWMTKCTHAAHKGNKNIEISGKISYDKDKNEVITSGKCKQCDIKVKKRTSWDTLAARFPHTLSSPSKKNSLLLRKGIYPYEYIDSFERFEETELPPKEAFYSSLTREEISDDDYKHAQRVWDKFKCKTLGDYHDIYLRTDVLLLADVFETFRDTSMNYYKLDPVHYITAPGMAWDALLKKTKVQLELLTDIDMHLFVEKGLRGGISMVSKRLATSNNPLCPGYNSEQVRKWIGYLDANNLYGWAMNEPLPTGGHRWVDDIPIEKVLTTADNAPKGYLLEVDLEYPEHLHDLHNDYPLAPETMKVPESWLSDYQRTLLEKLGTKYNECNKLVPNLCDKERYVVHYRTLKLYCQLGMRVTKIHRALIFNQEPWMAPYIKLNTDLRTKAKNEFEKDFFKLMNCSVFGKTMENLRKHIRVNLVCPNGEKESKKLRKLIADPAYRTHRIFDGNLIAIHSLKSNLYLNRPVYVGQAILDLSKLLMYDFWYNELKARYGDKVQLLYTDTDSLIFEVETEDLYEDMRKNAELYDFSDYPEDHPNFSTKNKKAPGKFKDECNSRLIEEFIALRSKMYSLREVNGNNLKKAKGVKKNVVQKDLQHKMYKECLEKRKEMRHKQTVIRSQDHQMGVYEQVKTSLSPLDTKKWIAPDGISTLAYGHRLLHA